MCGAGDAVTAVGIRPKAFHLPLLGVMLVALARPGHVAGHRFQVHLLSPPPYSLQEGQGMPDDQGKRLGSLTDSILSPRLR